MARATRWQLHGLNNGVIFGLTRLGARWLPRPASYGIGHVGTWMAWRLMPSTTEALVENLRVVRPGDSDAELRRLALSIYRHYARDVVDFIRSLTLPDHAVERLFTLRGREVFDRLRAAAKITRREPAHCQVIGCTARAVHYLLHGTVIDQKFHNFVPAFFCRGM